MKATNEFHNPIGAFRRKVDYKHGEEFPAKAAEIFRIMKPFNDYLNRALAGFQMPER